MVVWLGGPGGGRWARWGPDRERGEMVARRDDGQARWWRDGGEMVARWWRDGGEMVAW